MALVLGGGGARAAYQVGVLQAIASRFPDVEPPILTGTSAGAINTAYLANHRGDWPEKVESLSRLWHGMKPSSVYRTAAVPLLCRALWAGIRLAIGPSRRAPSAEGLVDTAPLRATLARAMGVTDGVLAGIAHNLATGRLKAVALTTTRYATGQTITFFSGRDIEAWERPQRKAVETNLTLDHVMASAALPLFFPSVEIDRTFYGDGGIRIVAPFAPAVHLGARRILAVSTRYRPTLGEADSPNFHGPPPLAQILGVLYNSVFLDMLDHDAHTMDRINVLVRAIPAESRGGLREVGLLVLRPSRNIGELANRFEPRLPGAFRYLTRRLGTKRSRSQDLLSTVMFHPDYVQELFELGVSDTVARMPEIEEFLAANGPGSAGAAPGSFRP